MYLGGMRTIYADRAQPLTAEGKRIKNDLVDHTMSAV